MVCVCLTQHLPSPAHVGHTPAGHCAPIPWSANKSQGITVCWDAVTTLLVVVKIFIVIVKPQNFNYMSHLKLYVILLIYLQ